MRRAPDLGDGWYYLGVSAMQTTITVPEGGGDLSFQWRMPESDDMDNFGLFSTDEAAGFLDTMSLADPRSLR